MMYKLSRSIQEPVHDMFGIWLYDVHDMKLWKKRLFSLKMIMGGNNLGL